MPSHEPRAALGTRKPLRPHPASPPVSSPEGPHGTQDLQDVAGVVMFCVRVTPSLRRRVKLAAVSSGRTIQQLTIEALEGMCRNHGV